MKELFQTKRTLVLSIGGVVLVILLLIIGLFWQKARLDSAATAYTPKVTSFVADLKKHAEKESLIKTAASYPKLDQLAFASLSSEYQKAQLTEATLATGATYIHDLAESRKPLKDDLSSSLYTIDSLFYYATYGATADVTIGSASKYDNWYSMSSEETEKILYPLRAKSFSDHSKAAVDYLAEKEKLTGIHPLFKEHAKKHTEEIKKYKSIADECLKKFKADYKPTDDTTDYANGCYDRLTTQYNQAAKPYSYMAYMASFVGGKKLTSVAIGSLETQLKTAAEGESIKNQQFATYISQRMAIASKLLPDGTSDKYFGSKADILRVILADARTELKNAKLSDDANKAIDTKLTDAEITMTLYDNPADVGSSRIKGAGGFTNTVLEIAGRPIDYAIYNKTKSYEKSFQPNKDTIANLPVPHFVATEMAEYKKAMENIDKTTKALDNPDLMGDEKGKLSDEQNDYRAALYNAAAKIATKIDREMATNYKALNSDLRNQLMDVSTTANSELTNS